MTMSKQLLVHAAHLFSGSARSNPRGGGHPLHDPTACYRRAANDVKQAVETSEMRREDLLGEVCRQIGAGSSHRHVRSRALVGGKMPWDVTVSRSKCSAEMATIWAQQYKMGQRTRATYACYSSMHNNKNTWLPTKWRARHAATA